MTCARQDNRNPANDTDLRRSGATVLHADHVDTSETRFQVGDPGRYLAPGLFQEMLNRMKREGIDPKYGFSIEMETEDGSRHTVTGFRSPSAGVHHFDQGGRELGTFLTETGYLAITPMALCVEPDANEQCQWISITEPFAIIAGQGTLMAMGSMMHLSLQAPMRHDGGTDQTIPSRNAANDRCAA